MKKILLVAAVLFSISMGAMAQSAKSALQFVDDKGKVIPDGSVFEVTELVKDEDFGEIFMKPNLFIKNVSGQTKVVAMKLDLKSMPEGRVQCCIDNCMMFSNPAVEISGSISIPAGKSESIETEWFLPNGTTTPKHWTAVLTAGLCKAGGAAYEYAEDGPSIKVSFGKNATAITSVKENTVTEVERFNVQGQKISKPCKGINIIKLSNGKTVKKLIP